MSKTNLDKLFQEKLENLSEVPTEKVWKSIEASLNKKKKNRKVIPLWWRLGGIAALLAIGLFVINPFKGTIETNSTITNIENDNSSKERQNDNLAPGIIETDAQITESNPSKITEDGNNKANDANSTEANIPTGIVANNQVSGQTGNTIVDEEKDKVGATLAVVDPGAVNKASFSTENELTTAVAEASKASNPSDENAATDTETTTDLNALSDLNTGIAQNDPGKSPDPTTKKSIYDVIAANEEEAVATTPGSKWSAGASVAPVYFSAIGEGSPVHPIFVPNSKSGDVNLSYGLTVAYEISKKLSVKTGLHKVDYGYNTNDVEFSSSLQSFGNGQIYSIDYSTDSRNIIVESKASNTTAFGKEATDLAAKDPSLYGVMAQQLGYLEVPVELNYALIDKKFGINLIGGFSSLFLVDNAVSLNSGELVTEIGEANNINNVNFSTNVGFGVNYKFTSKIQLNVEPVFKYQLNTFSETTGEFRPFTIGVYSGLNFKF